MMIVFMMYLEKGTQESPMTLNRSVKLLSVGFFTKIAGGYWNISSSGFRELFTIMTSGRDMNIPHMIMIVKSIPFPATERLSFFCL